MKILSIPIYKAERILSLGDKMNFGASYELAQDNLITRISNIKKYNVTIDDKLSKEQKIALKELIKNY